jgi:sulfur-oxidizing protein SoxX
MKRFAPLTTMAMVAALAPGHAASAAEVAPGDVAYTDGSVAASLTGTAGDPAQGRAVMGDRGLGNCVACHQVSAMADVPWQGEIGPSLDGVASRWDEAQLRGIVANAKMTFDGTIMPAFYKVDGFIRPGDEFTGNAAKEITPLLSAQQIEDVVAFLSTLKQ